VCRRGGDMSPFRWDVLVCGFVLAVPVLMLGMRGELTADEVATRLVWCLGAGWAAVALVRFALAPRGPASPAHRGAGGPADQGEQPADGGPAAP
jgi:hypothetical protein